MLYKSIKQIAYSVVVLFLLNFMLGGAVYADFNSDKNNILTNIKNLNAKIENIEIEKTPIKNIYRVFLPNDQVFLMTNDGKYMLGDKLLQLTSSGLQDVKSEYLTKKEAIKESSATKLLSELKKEDLVVFPASKNSIGSVYVFTDVKCGYCRKFHSTVRSLNSMGVEVRYLAGPFYSNDRKSLEKIWCAPDKNKAMDNAKTGKPVATAHISDKCKSIVDTHMAIGRSLGVRGTPAIFLESGKQIGGYLEPNILVERLLSK